jgi:formate hydrogenlyase subunit 3/multisubunit Na+/H+ antiporter MnhD subunit
MSQNEKIKEQIGWLKVAFVIFTAILVSLVGWYVTYYDNHNVADIKKYLTLLGILTSSAIIIVVNKIAFKKIDELGEL